MGWWGGGVVGKEHSEHHSLCVLVETIPGRAWSPGWQEGRRMSSGAHQLSSGLDSATWWAADPTGKGMPALKLSSLIWEVETMF